MLVGLLPGLQEALGIVDPAGIALQTKKDLSSGSRTVHTKECQQLDAEPWDDTNNGDRRLSKPAR